MSTHLMTRSTLRKNVRASSRTEPVRQLLSASMEKTFLKWRSKPAARHAYVKAEVATALSHQIRAIRLQRGWTQGELAKRLGTTQAAISRIEDPSYGRITIGTLLDLARAFDSGLQIKFVSLVSMLNDTFVPNAAAREVPSFEDEAPHVDFYRSRVQFIPPPSHSNQPVLSMCLQTQSPVLVFTNIKAPWEHVGSAPHGE